LKLIIVILFFCVLVVCEFGECKKKKKKKRVVVQDNEASQILEDLKRKETNKGNAIILPGSVSIITGASRGIGAALARALVARGGKVVLFARDSDDLRNLYDELSVQGDVIRVAGDVTSDRQVAIAFVMAQDSWGSVDFVFANAAIEGSGTTSIDDPQGMEGVERLFDVNVLGYYRTIHNAVRYFGYKEEMEGAIVLVGSIAAHVPPFARDRGDSVLSLAYGPSKAAIDHLVRVMGPSFAQNKIRLYGIDPGVYESSMVQRIAKDLELQKGVNTLAQINPVFPGYPGDPSDIAEIVMAMFTNTTAYPPSSIVVCDNHVTYDAQHHYNHIATPHQQDQVVFDVPTSALRDVTGHLCIDPMDGNAIASKEKGAFPCPQDQDIMIDPPIDVVV